MGRYESDSATDGWGAVWAIHEDRLGAVWVATNRGLLKFEGDKVAAHYTTKDGLPSDESKSFTKASVKNGQSVMWFGTFGGLAQFKDGRFTSYTTAQGLTGNRVRSLYEDADGTLWVGTYDDGLSRFRDGHFFSYRTEHGLFNNGVFQILEDRHSYFWISCNKGIYRFSRPRVERNGRRPTCAQSTASPLANRMECSMRNATAAANPPVWLQVTDGSGFDDGRRAVVDPEAAQINQFAAARNNRIVTLDRAELTSPGRDGRAGASAIWKLTTPD